MIDRLPPPMRAALEAAYAVPVRAYHHFGHALDVLAEVETLAETPGWRQPREVQLAALYHDAVYEAGRRDNETRSAELAREHLARWLPDAGLDVARVVELIELTARHGRLLPADVDEEAALFLDCDMAILGAEPTRFDAYDRGIAAEYRSKVPGWLFVLNRKRFLKSLLARERIFLSGYFHGRLDAAARANLRRAITRKQ